MVRNYLLLLVFTLFLCLPGKADGVTRALKKLQKNKPESAKKRLDKALSKDPKNAGAHYVYALYLMRDSTDQSLLDSAYACVRMAQAHFSATPRKDRRSWVKVGIDSLAMWHKKLELDSLAFVRAGDTSTVASYQYFMDHFPTASQVDVARSQRNALAFADAQRAHTYQRYKQFVDAYPDAAQAAQAQEAYDVLLFEDQTRGGTADKYAAFVAQHPESPFRAKAERRVFEIVTAPHTLAAYRSFIQKYPDNQFVGQAWWWMYYLYKANHEPSQFVKEYPDFYDKAAVEKRIAAHNTVYFPVFEDDKFGMVDAKGALQIPIQYDSVSSDYFCEGAPDDYILTYRNGKLLAVDKTGNEIVPAEFNQIAPLDDNLLRVAKNGMTGVYHRAGFPVVPPSYDEIDVLDDYALIVRHDGQEGLMTMNGQRMTPVAYDRIFTVGDDCIAFENNHKLALTTHRRLFQEGDTTLQFLYDHAEWIKNGYLRVLANGKQGVLNAQLQTVIAPVAAQISPTPVGWTVQNAGKIRIYRADGRLLSDSVFTHVVGNNPVFYAVCANARWSVLGTDGRWFGTADFDTIPLLNDRLFVARQKNTLLVSVGAGQLVTLGNYARVRVQKSAEPPHPVWLIVEDRSGKLGLFTLEAKKVLPALYDDIQVWNPDQIYVKTRGKYGLLDGKGKVIIPPIYDGLSRMENGYVATLKNGKFGLFDVNNKQFIAPQYSSLLKKYDPNWQVLIAREDNKMGLISRENQPLSEFLFDEIRYWQPGVALVKQQETWHLYHIAEKRFISQPLDYITSIREDASEIVLKVYRDKTYGILSNVHGQVINCEYDDLRNVGNETNPLYVAEKFVENADVYLVYYLDKKGHPIRKQIFNQKKYNRIVCE